MPRNSGHLASGGWSCWDAEPHGTNPGHPGKSGTGGNPTLYTPRNVLTANEISVPKIAMNDTIRFLNCNQSILLRFLCLNLMPPGVSGVLLKIMSSCDKLTCCRPIYLSLCVFTACVLANKAVHFKL